ncbi:DUF1328 domain-containing protein [Pelagicoccus sp. SDUM812002]|uniref:DUF1328 domain-containing protein n=1 Tax=Pelagicoccus sp. SDUM812002 TaxID=3041266 RepID=UPI00280DA2D1|nr:DUF1328 domain-containing protein [Pelagicoccus sp. SDUM812002]MDQ8185283.1 DUF1328 domain-containing protein [Pelagicoccus sp. SDUM812002]
MLRYSPVFLILAIISAALGFGGVSGAAAPVAQVLFFLFLSVWVVSVLLARWGSGEEPR